MATASLIESAISVLGSAWMCVMCASCLSRDDDDTPRTSDSQRAIRSILFSLSLADLMASGAWVSTQCVALGAPDSSVRQGIAEVFGVLGFTAMSWWSCCVVRAVGQQCPLPSHPISSCPLASHAAPSHPVPPHPVKSRPIRLLNLYLARTTLKWQVHGALFSNRSLERLSWSQFLVGWGASLLPSVLLALPNFTNESDSARRRCQGVPSL